MDERTPYDALRKDRPPESAGVSPVLPVSLFVSSARLLLERHLGLLWIGGEISGCMRAASGHLYFTLKDASAQVRCVFFRNKAQGTPFTLRDGLAVEVRAVASIYEARGEFQLNVETVRLAGLGALYERYVARKRALEAAGLFDNARKRALPRYPRRIGIVTSRRAAALRDVLAALARRFAGLPVIVYPASVQGASAAGEVAAAISIANQRAEVDVLIVCRGGGSLEDLWAFNEDVVAHAVFESRLPLVSGVGHETDFTICDFVADIRAATPTAAATLVAPDRDVLVQQTRALQQRLRRAYAHQADSRAQRTDVAARRLVHPAARLAQQTERALRLGERFAGAFGRRLADAEHRVSAVRGRLARELRAPVAQAGRVALVSRAVANAAKGRISRAERELHRLGSALALLNPASVLDRGYAIVTTPDGRIVSDARRLAVGNDVALRFARGRAEARITAVMPHEDD